MKTKFSGILTLLLAFVVQLTFAQEKTISGTVSDETGPLPGVSVLVKGTTIGAETDFNGKYSIKVESGKTLVFSFVGMKTKEIVVGSNSKINLVLESDNVLEEVVVTALGRSKEKEKLGYAVGEVKSEDLEKSTDANIVNALAGKVAGVSITNSSGDVGASSNIVIRGTSSITGNNQALFVVDGIPIDNQTLSTNTRGGHGTNRAGDIDMTNVESVTVLKGGAATVLYGERASNGVVVITTKKGKNTGKLNVSLKSSYTIGKPNKFHNLIHDYTRGRYGDYSNGTHWNWGPAYSTNPVFPAGTLIDQDGVGELTDVGGKPIPRFFDNYKNFFLDSNTNTQNVSVNGANEKGNFMVSFGRSKTNGVVRNSEYERYNFDISGRYNVTDKFNFGANAKFINSERISTPGLNGGLGWGSGLIYYHHMWDLVNRSPVNAQGTRTWFSGAVVDPMWAVTQTNENNKINRIIGSADANYNFSSLFNVTYRIGVDNYTDIRKRMRPVSDVSTTSRTGDMYDWRATVTQINSDLLISGDKDLTEDLNISYLVGGNINNRMLDRIRVTGKEQVLPRYYNITNYVNFETTAKRQERKTYGLFGELAFDYKNFLLLSVTGRNDWSSTLPPNNNSFFYPAVNGGFIFSKLMDSNFLTFGKVRASWSKVGKSAPIYSLYDTFDKLSTNALGSPRSEVSDLQKDSNIKPELSSEYEVGLELKVLKNKISLDATYYDKKTIDQHVRVPLTNTTGYSRVITNAGIVRNKGIEAVLTFKNLATFKDFDWDLGFNFTKNTNKVEDLPEGLDQISLASGWWTNTTLVARKGMPIGTIVGTAYLRDDNGNILTENGTPIKDQVNQVIGNTVPDYVLGINGNMNYKGFGLSFLFEIKQGGDVINDAKAGFIYAGTHEVTADRWYPSASDPSIGRPTANATKIFAGIDRTTGLPNTTPQKLTNDFWTGDGFRKIGENFVEDASWLRLRNVALSYTLPNKVVEKIGFSDIKFSVIGTNLWLKTDYSGQDPETSAFGAGNFQGFDILSAPSTKNYSFNVKLNF